MGLAERRKIKQLKEEVLPDVNRRLKEATGLDIPVEVEVDPLAQVSDLDAANSALDWLLGHVNYGEFWNDPIRAFGELTADELGKGSLREHLKRWRVLYQDGLPSGLSLQDGVLVQSANFIKDGSGARLFMADFRDQVMRLLAGGGLSLEERRNIKQIKDEVIPDFAHKLAKAVGRELPVELSDDFARMPAGDGRRESIDWLRGYYNSGEFWNELHTAIEKVCVDDLGKEAMAAVKKLVVAWAEGGGSEIKLQDGVLRYTYNFIETPRYADRRMFADAIQKSLEQQL